MGVTTLDRWTVAGIAALIALYALLLAAPGYETVNNRAEDVLLELTRPPPSDAAVVVVDIDRASLAAIGPWPWSRDRLAGLVQAIVAARPAAIALDILIEGGDERSPAALARTLGRLAERPDLTTWAATLPDGNRLLIDALKGAPSVLGLAVDPENPGNDPPAPPMLVAGADGLANLWLAPGAIGPQPPIAAAAQGLGIIALPGDGDARVRNVPLLVRAGGQLRPGLALELVRVAAGVGAYIVDGRHGRLSLGGGTLRLPDDGMLRLRPSDERTHAARSIAATDVLAGGAALERLRGALVLLGTSAPEIGGLRPSTTGDLVPTVQLQADAVQQIVTRDLPYRPAAMSIVEWLAAALLAIAAGRIAARRPPHVAAAATLAMIGGWLLASFAMLDVRHILADPVAPALAAGLAFAASALWTASRTRAREAAIRRRFEQQLPPAVVRRLLEQPGLLKLEGEARVVTALFTDIEGFTAMTERAGPRLLVEMLDRYFEGVVRLVVEHGGMVEKIVGDGLHAIFNAPVDLDDHRAKALACAEAIVAFSEAFRAEGSPATLGFGRTRIGIETGEVVVGDVGGGRHVDYTAHGDAMNTAARLEAANKDLGSTICIGPVAAAGIGATLLRPLGALRVRGRADPLDVFEPWPAAITATDRETFLVAVRLSTADPASAVAALTPLAARYPADRVIARRLDDLTRRCAGPP